MRATSVDTVLVLTHVYGAIPTQASSTDANCGGAASTLQTQTQETAFLVVSLEPKQVVIGLANAWAEHEAKGEPVKAVYLDERHCYVSDISDIRAFLTSAFQDEIASAWERMDSVGLAPRGFG
eukprot:910938-Rhodomonas_salina.2